MQAARAQTPALRSQQAREMSYDLEVCAHLLERGLIELPDSAAMAASAGKKVSTKARNLRSQLERLIS